MLKSTNKIFASSESPIIAYNDGSKTKIRSYIDKDSNTVILSNFSEIRPHSPISGKVMLPNVGDRFVRNLSKSDFDSLVNIATCPKCGKKIYTSKAIASALSKAFCVHCGELLDVKDGKDYYNKLGDLIDEVDTEIKKTEETAKPAVDMKVEKPVEETKEVAKGEKPTVDNTTMVKSSIDALIDEVLSESEKDKEAKEDKALKEAESSKEEVKSEEETNSENEEVKSESEDEILEDLKVDMLSTVASFNDLKIIPSGSDNFHYIMANKKPVAMLHKFRAISAVADIFENLSILENTLKESVLDKNGFTKEVVSSFGIVPLIMKVKSNKVIESRINKKVAEVEANAKQTIEDAINSYNQCLGIAVAGLNKNAFDDCSNTLADELINKFNAVGVKDAETIVKATFEAHADKFLLQIINKANSFKDKSLEERNMIANSVINFNSKESKITPSMIDNIEAVEDAKQKEASDITEVLFGK